MHRTLGSKQINNRGIPGVTGINFPPSAFRWTMRTRCKFIKEKKKEKNFSSKGIIIDKFTYTLFLYFLCVAHAFCIRTHACSINSYIFQLNKVSWELDKNSPDLMAHLQKYSVLKFLLLMKYLGYDYAQCILLLGAYMKYSLFLEERALLRWHSPRENVLVLWTHITWFC